MHKFEKAGLYVGGERVDFDLGSSVMTRSVASPGATTQRKLGTKIVTNSIYGVVGSPHLKPYPGSYGSVADNSAKNAAKRKRRELRAKPIRPSKTKIRAAKKRLVENVARTEELLERDD